MVKTKQKKKEYHILPTIKVLESLMLMGQVCRVGFSSGFARAYNHRRAIYSNGKNGGGRRIKLFWLKKQNKLRRKTVGR